jgi:peptidoglycan/LPS O-acetylase OafA/YrhL
MKNNFFSTEIQGLRGISILLVLFFHLYGFKPGYLGVDIFFIISGYLISFKLINENNINYYNFILNRFNKLYPGILITLLLTLISGYYLLFSKEYLELSKNSLFSIFNVKNIAVYFFNKESSYFKEHNDILLHFWSLSNEFQFYILYPLLLLLLNYKIFINYLNKILFLIFIISLFTHFIISIKYPIDKYYYAPYLRIWEFFLGAIIFLNTKSLKNLAVNNILIRISTLTTALLVNIYLEYCHFISLFMISLYSVNEILVSRNKINYNYLNNFILIFFGKISFYIYLIHYVIITFNNILHIFDNKFFLLIIIILLSSILHKFCESIFLIKKYRKYFLIALTLFIIIFSLLIYSNNGLVTRKVNERVNFLSHYNYFLGYDNEEEFNDKNHCFNLIKLSSDFNSIDCNIITNKHSKKIMLIGDSYAGYLYPGFKKVLDLNKYNFFTYSYANCLPLSSIPLWDEVKYADRCKYLNHSIDSYIKQIKPDVLILFVNFNYKNTNNLNIKESDITENIFNKVNQYKLLGIEKIILISQMPNWKDKLPNVIYNHYINKHLDIPVYIDNDLDKNFYFIDEKLKVLSTTYGVQFISLADFLCNRDLNCKPLINGEIQDGLLLFDGGHLTLNGSIFVSQKIVNLLNF